MKKKLFPLFILTLTLGLVSCGNTPTSEPTTVAPTSEPTTTSEESTSAPLGDLVDYVHNDERARLKLDYKKENGQNRNFFEDGIGEVTLRNTIDGDTAHFNVDGSDKYLKSRFYGIDTPESTGQIELWGKSASLFTKEKLINARDNGTIVVSSPAQTYEAPQLDSTGTRYLSLVWINETVKNAPYDSLILLNLWIVQEGFSPTKAVDKVPEYADVFFEADAQAQAHKLHIWGKDIDPNWNYGDYEACSIIAIKDQERWSKKYGYENPYYGANVHIEGTVLGYSDHIVYVQEYYSFDWLQKYLDKCLEDELVSKAEYDQRLAECKDGAYAGLGLFTGMSFSNDTKYTTPNTRIEVNGQVGYQFGLQIQGINFPNRYDGGKNSVHVLYTAEEVLSKDELSHLRVHEFDVKGSQLQKDDTYMFMKVNVTDTLEVVGGKKDADDGSIRLDVNDASGTKMVFSISINFQFKPLPDNPRKRWDDYTYFVGQHVRVKGVYYFFTYNAGTYSVDYYNILLTCREDLELLDPIA